MPLLQSLLTPITTSASALRSGELKSLPLSIDSANPHVSSSACLFCGRHHSLAQCRGVLNLIAQHKARQLANHGGTSKPPFHRGSSWRTKNAAQFGARAHSGGGNGAADRGKRSGGGKGAAWGNGHHGRRGSPPGRSFRDDSRRPSKRVGFSSRPTPRFHTNNVSVPEHGDEALSTTSMRRETQALTTTSMRRRRSTPKPTSAS